MFVRIGQFLGYVPEDLEGKSAYNFHHVLDDQSVLKSYKTRNDPNQMLLISTERCLKRVADSSITFESIWIGFCPEIQSLSAKSRLNLIGCWLITLLSVSQYWPKVRWKRSATASWRGTEATLGFRHKHRWSTDHGMPDPIRSSVSTLVSGEHPFTRCCPLGWLDWHIHHPRWFPRDARGVADQLPINDMFGNNDSISWRNNCKKRSQQTNKHNQNNDHELMINKKWLNVTIIMIIDGRILASRTFVFLMGWYRSRLNSRFWALVVIIMIDVGQGLIKQKRKVPCMLSFLGARNESVINWRVHNWGR